MLGTPTQRLIAATVGIFLSVSCFVCHHASGAAPAPAVNKPIGDKWAVVIGCGTFANPDVPSLRYSAKDARDLYNYLISPDGGKFKPDHVVLLLDKDATKQNIEDVVGGSFLPFCAAPDDLVFIYISTHGSPSDADVRGANYIITHDTNMDRLYATSVDMNELVRQMRIRILSQRKILVLDTCYSGASTKTGSSSKGLKRTSLDSSGLADGLLGSVVICSSSLNQRSWESEKLQNSYFTHQFIQELQREGAAVDLRQVFEHMRAQVQEQVMREKGAMQTPVFSGEFHGPLPVLGKAPSVLHDARPWAPIGGRAGDFKLPPLPKSTSSLVLVSDAFDRPDAGKDALGQPDLSLGGNRYIGYMPTFPSPAGPIGASIAGGALENNGKDFGGVQLRPFTAQDLNIGMDIQVPTDAAGHISMGGPYFRSRWANPGDGIIGGTSSGFWVRLASTGQISVRRLNPNSVVGISKRPSQFDSTVFHNLECAVKGDELRVWLDKQPVSFQTESGASDALRLPPTEGNNDGTAGICFGAEDNRGQIGGQRVDNLVVSEHHQL